MPAAFPLSFHTQGTAMPATVLPFQAHETDRLLSEWPKSEMVWVGRNAFLMADAAGDLRDVYGVVPRSYPLGCPKHMARRIRSWHKVHPCN